MPGGRLRPVPPLFLVPERAPCVPTQTAHKGNHLPLAVEQPNALLTGHANPPFPQGEDMKGRKGGRDLAVLCCPRACCRDRCRRPPGVRSTCSRSSPTVPLSPSFFVDRSTVHLPRLPDSFFRFLSRPRLNICTADNNFCSRLQLGWSSRRTFVKSTLSVERNVETRTVICVSIHLFFSYSVRHGYLLIWKVI